jgi:hypothetical protein
VDRPARLVMIFALIAIAAWRLSRYLKLAMSARRSSLGVAGGWFPTPASPASLPADSAVPTAEKTPFYARAAEFVVAVVIWLTGNALAGFCVLEVPPINSMPPVPIGIAWIFGNFYLIPWARNTARRCRRRFENANIHS